MVSKKLEVILVKKKDIQGVHKVLHTFKILISQCENLIRFLNNLVLEQTSKTNCVGEPRFDCTLSFSFYYLATFYGIAVVANSLFLFSGPLK